MKYKSGENTVDITSRQLKYLFLSLRPKQWTKNFAVFAALIFSQHAADAQYVLKSLFTFATFSLLSGGVYLLNDLLDIEKDRAHPVKCKRPLAAGRLSTRVAWIAFVLLLAVISAATVCVDKTLFAVLTAYMLLQVSYSIWLKHIVILDVFAIAMGFVLRVIAGATAISVPVSSWLLLCTMLLALFLALSKRRHEIILLEGKAAKHRRILDEYSTSVLDQMISVVTAATVISYAMYTVADETVARFHTDKLIYTLPFVLYGVFRYLYIAYKRNEGGSPDVVLLTDKPLIACLLSYLAAAMMIIYT